MSTKVFYFKRFVRMRRGSFFYSKKSKIVSAGKTIMNVVQRFKCAEFEPHTSRTTFAISLYGSMRFRIQRSCFSQMVLHSFIWNRYVASCFKINVFINVLTCSFKNKYLINR